MRWRPDRVDLPGLPGCDRPVVDVAGLRRVSAAAAIAVTAIQAATGALALRDGRRRWGLAGGLTVWAARLSHQMLSRIRDHDQEDPRYTEFLDGDGTGAVLAKVFVTQGLSQLIVSAPVQLAAVSRLPGGPRRWLAPAGLTLLGAGALIEALADRQKSRYSQLDDDEKPGVLDTGLWGWSRHPNYFGDSLVWDGAWLAAAASPPGALAVPAPMLMSYLLMFATGAKRTEARMEDRPGYRDYQDRVAFFFPWPISSPTPELGRNA